MPGYIVSQTYHRGVRGPDPTDQQFIASTAVGGVLTHLVALPWTVSLLRGATIGWTAFLAQSYLAIALWVIIVLLVLPAVIGAGWRQLSALSGPPWAVTAIRWFGLSADLRTAEAWTWLFRRIDDGGEGHWLRISLRDGGTVVGAFGPGSFASSDPQLRDLYVEKTWPVDAAGSPLVDDQSGGGMWIRGDAIESVELFGRGEE